MKIIKKFGQWFVNLFGFHKNTAYVNNYLNSANMRSGVYMAAVIFVVEIWMIIRQTIERVVPMLETSGGNFFNVFYSQTSNFWLMLFLSLSMLIYCLYTTDKRINITKTIVVIVSAAIGLLLFAFIDYPTVLKHLGSATASTKNLVSASLLLSFYIAIALFQIFIIISSIYQYRGGKSPLLTSVVIISLFALTCLVFGMMVSYSDFFGYAKDPVTGSTLVIDGKPVPAYKQIICFLMMSLYVGCLLIWKPYISISILGVIFLGFHMILVHLPGIDREVQDGDTVNYITFFISLSMLCISIYSQRTTEAKKDEELELLATTDTLTGLYAFEYFTSLINKKCEEKEVLVNEWVYLFVDVTSFKIYNDQRGFTAGNECLKRVGSLLKEEFPEALVSRQSDDHYVIFCKNEEIQEKINEADKKAENIDLDIRLGLKVGGYILKDKEEDPHRAVEKARYACTANKTHGHDNYLIYDQKMHDNYRLVQYVVKHIDEAIENGYIQAYYQPVVWSNTKELCGTEALARWIDPRYGFMNPGLFVGALEDAQLIHKLDVAMLRNICRDLRYCLDRKRPVVPVSINFSRADFTIINVPEVIESVVNEYKIPKELLHIEVTESALLSEGSALKDAMKELKAKGFSLWLDDFGSGYSSFNALKDFDFDVLKLDMQFLVGFSENKKAKSLIKSVISMAEEIGMKTLSEGVENEEQANFLKEISCGKLQGYLFGKPMPLDEIKHKVDIGEFTIAKKFER